MSATKMQDWMFQEKVKILYRNQTRSWLLSIMASAIIAYGFSWWLVFVVITLLRTWNTAQFHRAYANNAIENYSYWFKRFFAGTFIAALGWCAGAFIIGVNVDPLSKMFIFILLIGVGAAAIPMLGVFQSVMIGFQSRYFINYNVRFVSYCNNGFGKANGR